MEEMIEREGRVQLNQYPVPEGSERSSEASNSHYGPSSPRSSNFEPGRPIPFERRHSSFAGTQLENERTRLGLGRVTSRDSRTSWSSGRPPDILLIEEDEKEEVGLDRLSELLGDNTQKPLDEDAHELMIAKSRCDSEKVCLAERIGREEEARRDRLKAILKKVAGELRQTKIELNRSRGEAVSWEQKAQREKKENYDIDLYRGMSLAKRMGIIPQEAGSEGAAADPGDGSEATKSAQLKPSSSAISGVGLTDWARRMSWIQPAAVESRATESVRDKLSSETTQSKKSPSARSVVSDHRLGGLFNDIFIKNAKLEDCESENEALRLKLAVIKARYSVFQELSAGNLGISGNEKEPPDDKGSSNTFSKTHKSDIKSVRKEKSEEQFERPRWERDKVDRLQRELMDLRARYKVLLEGEIRAEKEEIEWLGRELGKVKEMMK